MFNTLLLLSWKVVLSLTKLSSFTRWETIFALYSLEFVCHFMLSLVLLCVYGFVFVLFFFFIPTPHPLIYYYRLSTTTWRSSTFPHTHNRKVIICLKSYKAIYQYSVTEIISKDSYSTQRFVDFIWEWGDSFRFFTVFLQKCY